MPEKQSKCCGSPVEVEYSRRSTGMPETSAHPPETYTLWHFCTKCGNPCDVVSAASDGEDGG